MLDVIYSEDEIFSLPPPSLFIRGSDCGFEKLKVVIETMLLTQSEMCLNDFDFVVIIGTAKRVLFRPFSNKTLLKIYDDAIVTDISAQDWKEIISHLNEILESDFSLTYFIEFEDYVEEGNVIIES